MATIVKYVGPEGRKVVIEVPDEAPKAKPAPAKKPKAKKK